MAVVPKFSLVQDAPPNLTLALLGLGIFLVSDPLNVLQVQVFFQNWQTYHQLFVV